MIDPTNRRITGYGRRQIARVLARGLAAALADPGATEPLLVPRHSRRHLSDPLVRIDSQGPQAEDKDVTFVRYTGEGQHIRAPVALD